MIRLSSRIRRLASVSAGIVLLSGCATHRAEGPLATAGGHITVRPGRPGLVVAAPPGTSDIHTGRIAEEIARQTGFGLVVASRFSLPADGRPPSEPEATETARRVDELYEQRVLEAARGRLRFYAEIHGHNRTGCAGQIEIATVGVDRELALRLRALAELIRDAHLRAGRDVQRLEVLIEPADPVTYRASGARHDGILRLPERGLHIELPRCARRDWRDAYTAILSDFLAQAVTLTAGRSTGP
jgi:hypothetical protein